MIERMVIICIFRIIYGFICSQEPFYPKIELEVKKLVKNKEKSAENKGIFRPPRVLPRPTIAYWKLKRCLIKVFHVPM